MAVPKDCPHASNIREHHACCALFIQACGFNCSVLHEMCETHMKAGGWEVPIDDVPELATMIPDYLSHHIIAGDCPRYETEGAGNLDDAFARLAARVTKAALASTLVDAVVHWIAIGRKHGIGASGGHPHEIIDQKAQKIARDHGLEDALSAWERERLAG